MGHDCRIGRRARRGRYLYLGRTRITDGGFERLIGLAKLRELHVTRTSVTEAGVQRLQRALPKCVIRYRAEP
jgi:hypothetical protein